MWDLDKPREGGRQYGAGGDSLETCLTTSLVALGQEGGSGVLQLKEPERV